MEADSASETLCILNTPKMRKNIQYNVYIMKFRSQLYRNDGIVYPNKLKIFLAPQEKNMDTMMLHDDVVAQEPSRNATKPTFSLYEYNCLRIVTFH
jgi:hypothetical protein